MVLLCWWNFQVIPIILWEDYYIDLEALAWIVGWKVVALRLGCDIPILYNSMYLLDYINTNLFP